VPDGLGHRGVGGPARRTAAGGFRDRHLQRGDRVLDRARLGDTGLGELGDDGVDAGVPGPSGTAPVEAVRLGQGVEHGQWDLLGGIWICPQRGRVQFPQHLPQRHRRAVPAGDECGMRDQSALQAGQIARSGQRHRGECSGLQRARQADSPALGRRGLHLIGGLVIGEAFRVVVDRLVVGDGQRPAGGDQQHGQPVVVAIRGDGHRGRAAGALRQHRAEPGVAGRVVADLADVEQPTGVIDDGGCQPATGPDRRCRPISRS
jgi:hypothetical protein